MRDGPRHTVQLLRSTLSPESLTVYFILRPGVAHFGGLHNGLLDDASVAREVVGTLPAKQLNLKVKSRVGRNFGRRSLDDERE